MEIYSKKSIRNMLINYVALCSGDRLQDCCGNAGPKAYDGINSRILLRIMLDEAIGKLPIDLKRAIYYRWLRPVGLGKALMACGVKKTEYYRRCELAVHKIFLALNGGDPACAKNFAEKICTNVQ